MTRLALAVALLALSAVQPPPVGVLRCDASPLLVRNVDLWTSSGIVSNRDVLFRDGRVAAIGGPGGSHPRDGRAIDGTGHTLLPGLVDSHLHFVIPGGLGRGERPRTELEEISGKQLLRSGITSGRLHLATVEEAARLETRSVDPCEPLPRVQVGGPGISGAADRDFGNFQGAKTTADAVAKVERFRAAGVDWIAVHDADRFAPGVLDALAGAARKAGIRLMAAGSTPAEITAALAIRPDTLDYFDRTDAPQYTEAVLNALRSLPGLILVPTPGVPYRTVATMRNPGLLEQPELFEFLAAPERDFVIATAKEHLAGPEAGRAGRVMQSLPAKFGQLRQLGLKMALGSDAGSPLHFPATAIWWELEAWRALGASHREALVAATERGADVLGAKDVGRITVGSRADFVLYRGNVEQGPFDRARVVAVAKDGVPYVLNGEWTGGAGPIDNGRQ
jgi:imidazolonepropionase-like amidohydrolase